MKKPRRIANHHWVYPSPDHPEQEHKEPIFFGEHECATKMTAYSRKTVSRGFLRWLRFFVLLNEDRAIDLAGVKKEEGA